NFCVSREGSIALVIYDDVQGGMILKPLDAESGTLSGGSRLSSLVGLGTGVERGVLVIDRIGAYDLDMESGEKSWHMKWNGTSYIPTYEKFLLAVRIREDGTLEQIKRDDDKNYYLSYLWETHPEEEGKIPLVFRVLSADVGLKKIVARFNRENGEYHVFLEDRGEEYGWNLWTRTDLEIATGKGPDLIAADAVTDMRVLAEKGGLENLDPYLAQAGIDREGYHQETFQSQGMENGVYSAGYEIHIRSMYIREEFLDSSGQTDIKILLNNLEGYEGQAIFNSTWNYTPVNLMYYFFLMSDNFYGMVDWEGRTCDFSGELWEQILRVSNQYGLTERNREWEAIADLGYIYDFSSMVSREREAEKQGMVLAGYPSEDGMVNWLQMSSVAINANSAHKEGAWQFIRFLLDEENQALITRGIALPVHEEPLEESVEEYLYDYYYNTYTNDGRHIIRDNLPEGIEEKFWEGIANARPASYRTEQVIAIIAEEAEF
ncbi:MAG: extracellular solute-binding protein, partial [Lachnospiraceae bacterium]|nr:extracellular solute-binding protein [Lachnospiraceae bacterium]